MSTANSNLVSSKLMISLGVGLGVTMISGMSYFYYKYWKKEQIPQKWRRVGTLEQLYLFPVKSLAPMKIPAGQELECEVLGLRLDGFRDRALMVVDAEDNMVTARVYPKMILIKTQKVGESTLILSSPNMPDTLQLDFANLINEGPTKDVHTAVWGVKVDAMLCGEKYDRWISQAILEKAEGLRLVYYPYPMPVRSVVPRLRREPFLTKEDTGTFQDATSYMIMNLASIDDLNSRLSKPVDPLQFRGNFYLKMDKDEPYAEDHWQWVRVGDEAIFRVVAPCTRCIFTNIHVDSAERDPEGNPLKALNGYRKIPNHASPALGTHLGLRQGGKVKLHDVIYVEEK